MEYFWMKLRCITVEPVLFFHMMVVFLENNALQELLSVKSCIEFLNNPLDMSNCRNKTLLNFTDAIKQSNISWVEYNSVVLFLLTFICSFYVASWSDKIGRKFTMLVPPLAIAVAAAIKCALSIYTRSQLTLVLISSTICSLTFGTIGIVASTFGFIADISDESSRTKRFIILEAMMYFGSTLGIYISSQFFKYGNYGLKFNLTGLFLLEMSLSLFTFFYILFKIPNENEEKFEISDKTKNKLDLFNLDHIKSSVGVIFRSRDSGKRKIVLLLLLTLFFLYFGLVVQLTLSYYYLHDFLQWDIAKYRNFNALQFALQGLFFLIQLYFIRYLKAHDYEIAFMGVSYTLTEYVIFGVNRSEAIILICVVLYSFSHFPVPAIRSILSKTVDADEQGRIFAITAMMQNFCFFIGSFIMTSIYKNTKNIVPGLCFEIAAFLQACAVAIIFYLNLTEKKTTTDCKITEKGKESLPLSTNDLGKEIFIIIPSKKSNDFADLSSAGKN